MSSEPTTAQSWVNRGDNCTVGLVFMWVTHSKVFLTDLSSNDWEQCCKTCFLADKCCKTCLVQVVIGEDLCSKDCEFQSQYRILDGHIFIVICRKKLTGWFEKTKNKLKIGRDGPFFLKKRTFIFLFFDHQCKTDFGWSANPCNIVLHNFLQSFSIQSCADPAMGFLFDA